MTYILPTKTMNPTNFMDGVNNNSAVSKVKVDHTEGIKDDFNSLHEVADQFESIFLETLLSAARKSKLADGLFDSKADDNFEQMFDQELAKTSSKTVDLGIAEAIIRQMSKVGTSSE